MTDSSDKPYHDACSALFSAIEELAEAHDADYDNNGNVIEITTGDDEKIIINKQAPMREVWLAAKSGGRHYKLADGEWRDTRDNSALMACLAELLATP